MTEIFETIQPATPPDFKEPVGGGKRDRHPCPNSGDTHDWQCENTSCPDCWDPECVENAKKEQDDYDAKQSRAGKTDDDKIAEFKQHADDEIARGSDETGLQFEKATLTALGSAKVIHYSYKAHCPKCHVQGEIDVVTHDSVIECKNSAKGFKLDQISNNVRPIAEKCFPGKRLVFATRESQKRKLESKLRQWQQQGHITSFEILPV